jgi:hypothetical protein
MLTSIRPSRIALFVAVLVVIGGTVAYGFHLARVGSRWQGEWSASPHNFYPPSVMMSTRATCVNCHSSEGFAARMTGAELTEAEITAPKEYGISCKACHNVQNPINMLELRAVGDVPLSHGVTVSGGVSAACMSCHNARRGDPVEYVKTSFRGPHEGPQAEMLAGTGGITYSQQIGSSVHTLITFKGCLTCHKDVAPETGEHGQGHVAGHTFRMRWDGGTPNDPRDDVEHVDACQQACHPGLKTFDRTAKADYDGDGVVEGVQTEIKGLLAALAEVLPKDAAGNVSIPNDLKLTTLEQRMAAYNYRLVKYDGSFGIHNTAYAVNLLRTTYQQFTGKKLLGADALGVTFVGKRPDESENIQAFADSWARSPHNYDPAALPIRQSQRAGCVRCHNGEYFVRIQVNGEPQPDADLPEPAKHGITCYTCHETSNPTDILATRKEGDVTLPNGVLVGAGKAGLCMTCHNSRRPNAVETAKTSRFGPHLGPQSDMLAGTGAVEYGRQMRSSSHLAAVKDTCITCHMQETLPPTAPGHRQVGGHTLRMRWDRGTPTNLKDDIPHVAVCQSCHSDVTGATGFDRTARADFDGDGTVAGVQTEIKGLMALLAAALPKNAEGNVAIPSDLKLTTEAERMAAYNYQFVERDGSYGVHNPLYAADILRTAYTELTGKAITPPASKTPWDVNNDGVVNIADLVLVSLHFGETVTAAVAPIRADVDGSGKVDLDDIVKVSRALHLDGGTPSASGSATAWLDLQRLPLSSDGALLRASLRLRAADRAAGYTFSLAYDPAVVTLEGLGNGTYLARDANSVYWETPRVDEPAGRIDAATAVTLGDTVAPGNGDSLAYVTFRVRRLDAPLEKAVSLRAIQAANRTANPLLVRIGATRFNPATAHWRTALLQNFPNPFNPETWIPFDLAESADVAVQILTPSGERVRELRLGRLDPGAYRTRDRAAYWDGRNDLGERVSSGVYFYRIQAGTFSAVRKLVVVK